jgi:hypothetical protein
MPCRRTASHVKVEVLPMAEPTGVRHLVRHQCIEFMSGRVAARLRDHGRTVLKA